MPEININASPGRYHHLESQAISTFFSSTMSGEAFAFASPTQILTVGPFGVHVAKFYWAGASSQFTILKRKKKSQRQIHTENKPLVEVLELEVVFLVHSNTN